MQSRERPQCDSSEPDDPDTYFARRGFKLRVEERDLDAQLPPNAPSWGRTHWADLISLESEEVVAAAYGLGMDEAEAKRRAMRRYVVEQ